MNVFVLLISEVNKLVHISQINKRIVKLKETLKNSLISIILFAIQLFNKWYIKLNQKSKITNSQNFEDFTPITLDDKDDKYSEIIKYAIDNLNTKNVALTGPYGSGKSSILKTFESKHIENKYLNISLATFDEKEHQLKEIEYCILKQLFYKVEQDKIPESRFKRIINQKNVKTKAFFIFLWLISLAYFSKPNLLIEFSKNFSLNFYSKICNLFYTLYLLGGTMYLLYKTMGFILNFKFTKFSFQDTEIENGDDKKSINFENEIDEILYFFERNSFNVIFIEDLDRFKNTEIFIKLREINYLINNYDPIKIKRKITFIYAVQDDTFKEDERAKFFDFIIPVIPVINYSNSSIELLDKIDINKDGIPKSFIKQVARYLSDKRTLISINNEYKIYKTIIGNDLEKRKLLAMMIYKNVEPTDFDNLNSQKGYVYTVFSDYYKLIKSSIDTIDKKIIKERTKITSTEDEIFRDVNELKRLYIIKTFELLNNNAVGIDINNIRCTISQLLIESNFILFTQLTKINYYTYNSYSSNYLLNSSNLSFKKLELEVGSYDERLEIIQNKKEKRSNIFRKEIEKLENEKEVIRTQKIKDLVDDEYFEKCLGSLKYKESIKVKEEIDGKEMIITKEKKVDYKIQNIELINYLIRYGHIDDSYSHYISHFYPGSITKEDNDFLKSFTNNKPLPYNFKLQEIGNLFSDIVESDFSREEILNFSLLDYMLERKDTEKELSQIITLLSTKIHKPINFIDEYLIYTISQNQQPFLKALCKHWKNPNQNIWEEVWSNFSDEKTVNYLNLIFSTLDIPTILNLDIRNNISNYISEIESLKVFTNNDKKMTEFILETNIKFKNIDNEGAKFIFDFIYQNNNYEINEKMIELFVTRYSQKSVDIELLKTANYTTIKNSGASKLIKYIDSDIEFYIKTIFLQLATNCGWVFRSDRATHFG
ncbi:hypothetical protein SAMN05443667_1071 [Flavobacterium gillisiae]|uniref:YobI-like P-loop NTPase domain-containing protein n=1 Tax=Flavobacterium gillisiae TaxID=150146 RepID=A0A1H4D1G5_9FLAO|nr:hypothetical protein [Flavobacterium gillisiae]SEA66438.1 hypothetical protein SAMN05443667_1071 [Flavobacterium gillisiae]